MYNHNYFFHHIVLVEMRTQMPISESEKVNILHRALIHRDSLLNLWFNDYSWRIRVLSGIEKDTCISKYQKWNTN